MRRAIYVLYALGLLWAAGLARADDPGYFLSWQQKKDLLRLGRIQDAGGTWYDIWICPGYAPPARYAREHFKEAGGDFHEYIEANKYRSLKEGSKACFDWALDECGLGFTVKGIPRAWGHHFGVARERVQRRVFGWWMAYPWAFLESTVESAFRGALGTVGTVGGVVSGAAVVPVYHALDSAVAGVWNLSVNTIIIPVVGVSWNTVVGPPLALVGQKPSESRVDGFWVTIVGTGEAARARTLAPEEVAKLGEWGLLLLRETEPVTRKRSALESDFAARQAELSRAMQAMRDDANLKRTELGKEESALIQQAASNHQGSAEWIGRPVAQGGEDETALRRYLEGQHVAGADIQRTISLLRACQAIRRQVLSPAREKTDPLQRSAEIITDAAVDTLK